MYHHIRADLQFHASVHLTVGDCETLLECLGLLARTLLLLPASWTIGTRDGCRCPRGLVAIVVVKLSFT